MGTAALTDLPSIFAEQVKKLLKLKRHKVMPVQKSKSTAEKKLAQKLEELKNKREEVEELVTEVNAAVDKQLKH